MSESNNVNYASKISTKTLGLTSEVLRELCKEKKIAVMRIIGQASLKTTGTTDNGEYVKFKGRFEATNLSTGEVTQSAVLFLPHVASDILEGQLAGAKSENSDASVMFGFEIGVEKTDTVTGYQYSAASLVKETSRDVLSQLRESISDTPVLAGVAE